MPFSETLYRIATEAVLPGVSGVLSFIPTIALMIFLLTLLRESGLIKGPAALFLTGFSCSVPAITYCSTIPDKRTRMLIMFLIPYISCSAKLPIYVLISSIFFPAFPQAVIGCIYLLGILIVAASLFSAKHLGLIQSADILPMQSTAALAERSSDLRQGEASSLLRGRGLLRLRRPSLRVLFDAVTESCLGFVKKAFTVILAASVLVWILQNLDSSLHYTPDIDKSLLAYIGRLFEPLFAPLGFGDRRAISALLVGISSKESIVSTFAVLAGSPDRQALSLMLNDIFTPASAFSFMVFCLLYIPCIASLIAMKNVTGNLRTPLVILSCQTVFAWCLSFLIFHSIKVII
ncbi:MAG: ferrous iron transporter B [Firmicutes bacterium]|nr:ferrous iron transporter B [Bacillota bacterium]